MERLEVVRILKMVALGTSTSPSLSPIFFFYPSRPPLSCSSLSHVLKSFRLSCLLGTDGVYNLSGTPPNLTFISLQELLLHSSSFFSLNTFLPPARSGISFERRRSMSVCPVSPAAVARRTTQASELHAPTFTPSTSAF